MNKHQLCKVRKRAYYQPGGKICLFSFSRGAS